MGTIQNMILRSVSFVRSEHLRKLLVGRFMPQHVNRHRVDTIASRLTMVSIVFGVLTLLWVPIDVYSFSFDQWSVLVAARALIAAVFFAVAALPRKGRSYATTFSVLVIVMSNPMILHSLAAVLFADTPQSGIALINTQLYEALPYVVVTGLALFPLVAVEAVLLSIPVILVGALLAVFTGTFSWIEVISHSWILGLFLGVATLSGMIQSYYMEALLKRADHDQLTGAITRRSGTEIIEFSFRLSCDKDTHLTLAFLDLDHFKSLNDTYGHDAGDDALQQTVLTLDETLREADTVIRWGGEEFLIVLPDTSIDGAKIVMDRIVQDWLAERPDGQPLTASIGLAERRADGVKSWEALVETADKRMYAAKQGGRARYVWDS